MNSFFWSSGNLIIHRTTLAWMCVHLCLCVSREWEHFRVCVCVCVCVCAPGAPPSASTEQTPDTAPSRMAVRMSVPCERSKRSVALCSNHQGIYCPHDERGERIKRTGWREERGWDWREREEATDKGCAKKWKGKQGRRRKKGETESRMAKHGWKEPREQEWEMRNRWRKKGLRETEMKRKGRGRRH